MLIKSLIWNVFLTWIQIPKMKHFCSNKSQENILENYIILIITELKSDALQGQWQISLQLNDKLYKWPCR